MGRLEARVFKLELARGPRLSACAVVRAPLPARGYHAWAERLLDELGGPDEEAMIWVVDGAETEVLLPLTPYASLRGDAERAWVEQTSAFPQLWIVTGADGMMADYVEDDVARRRLIMRFERELVEGVG